MEEKQDVFEMLNKIKDDYEPNPDLAESVIEKINRRESTAVFKRTSLKWVCGALCCILVVFISVFLPVYFTKSKINSEIKITIYSSDSIEFEEINNLEEFMELNNLNFKFFMEESSFNKIAKIKANNKLAYFLQECEYLGENGFDYVKLNIVLLERSEFEFYNDFVELNTSILLNGVNINFSYNDSTLGKMKRFKAKFEFEGKAYFLEIDTFDRGIEVLEKYINQLLN